MGLFNLQHGYDPAMKVYVYRNPEPMPTLVYRVVQQDAKHFTCQVLNSDLLPTAHPEEKVWLNWAFDFDALRAHEDACGNDCWQLGCLFNPLLPDHPEIIPLWNLPAHLYRKKNLWPANLGSLFMPLRARDFDDCSLVLNCADNYYLDWDGPIVTGYDYGPRKPWHELSMTIPTLVSGPVTIPFSFPCACTTTLYFTASRGTVTPSTLECTGSGQIVFDPGNMQRGEQATITMALKWDALTATFITTRV